MLGQVLHLVVRRQGSEQLAVGGRGETVGMGEENLLRHGAGSGWGNDGPLSVSPGGSAMSVKVIAEGYQVRLVGANVLHQSPDLRGLL
ncbi:hypothetical protein D3C79_1046900 [compost metagenome]